MKLAAQLLLFVFIAFLATPTIVGLIKKHCDTSCFYNLSEEELAHKEIKAEFHLFPEITFVRLADHTSSLILSENLSRHDNVSSKIFIPPPEIV